MTRTARSGSVSSDYLSQGAIAPTLERLLDQARFSYPDWIDELGQIEVADEAREMRGDSARLLSSHPDHPGLLLARALSEVLDDRGDLREFSSNLDSSLRRARKLYGATEAALHEFASWLLAYCAKKRDGALAVAMAAAERHGLAPEAVRDWQRSVLEQRGGDAGARVLALAAALERLNGELASITSYYTRERT